ncbi:hypothetical protein CVD25_19330 [Bacillus canaveralius]|uniref:DUF4312 family protein n=1 Tax=Bacillus canaveralius TaxID=1403243 RepID=A0A2N5GLT4_9BACI|nr:MULTISPECIES: DUF4312 family protein [Bacillus]PLR75963.1 hypothetical protein CU633_18000 [Bacillus sp. V3-13]PLR82625.1 hypothetical protein CU635_11325 [Bacillus canaveralius]PLR91248.1 hypothetical protein CVD25_19330 [Bacillus canaveralius]
MEKVIQQKVRVQGTGKTKEHAVNFALGQIQKKVLDEHKVMMIRIEPLGIEVVKAIEQSYIERFMLFFFPRKRQTYKVVLDVTVQCTLLNINDIEFKRIDEPGGVVNGILRKQQMTEK